MPTGIYRKQLIEFLEALPKGNPKTKTKPVFTGNPLKRRNPEAMNEVIVITWDYKKKDWLISAEIFEKIEKRMTLQNALSEAEKAITLKVKTQRGKAKKIDWRKCAHGETGPNDNCICFELRTYGADE